MIKKFRSLVIFFTLLSVFGYMVHEASLNFNHFGKANKYILAFSKLPKKAIQVFEQLTEKSISLRELSGDEKSVNNLDYDLYAINSSLNEKQDTWNLDLINLKNDDLLHQWKISQDDFHRTDRMFQRASPQSSLLLKDRSLIAMCNESNNLLRLDKDSKIVWHNKDHKYHHAMNLDEEENIWVCSRELGVFENERLEHIVKYRDDCLTKVNGVTGETMFHKSISDLLIENDMMGVLFGSTNGKAIFPNDPIHLNDIQPVLKDGEYYKQGDVFVSIRNRSLIFLYRPSTNQVLKIIQGNFVQQHDVDIVSDSTIAIFNNNVPTMRRAEMKKSKLNQKDLSASFKSSGIEVYNFGEQKFESLYKDQFEKEEIFTTTEGLYTILSNGDVFVESTNDDKIYLFNQDKFIFKKYMNSSHEGYANRTHWMSIYENVNY